MLVKYPQLLAGSFRGYPAKDGGVNHSVERIWLSRSTIPYIGIISLLSYYICYVLLLVDEIFITIYNILLTSLFLARKSYVPRFVYATHPPYNNNLKVLLTFNKSKHITRQVDR